MKQIFGINSYIKFTEVIDSTGKNLTEVKGLNFDDESSLTSFNYPLKVNTSVSFPLHLRYQPCASNMSYKTIEFGSDT